jgi:tetratricopeptide (TPR) repeat protein
LARVYISGAVLKSPVAVGHWTAQGPPISITVGEVVRNLNEVFLQGPRTSRCQTKHRLWHATLLVLLFSFSSLAVCSSAQPQRALRAEQFAQRAFESAHSGDLAQAETDLRRAVVLAPDNPKFLGDLGAILGAEGKLRDAAVYLGKASKIDPRNLNLRSDLAVTESYLGEERRAQRNLEYILSKRPGDRQTTLLLGMVDANLKEYQQALALFESVPDLVKQQPQSVAALARCYYHTGQAAKARQLLLAMPKTQDNGQGIFLGAQIAEQAQDGPTAERLFDSIQSTYPDVPRLEYHLADAEYESGHYAESQSLLDRLVGSGHGTSEAFNLLGRCYAKEDRMVPARRALETAITLQPSKEAYYSSLTAVLLVHGEIPAALVAAKLWAGRFPASYKALSMKADIEMRLQLYKVAASSYRQALNLCPSSETAALGLAEADAGGGMESQAETAFQSGIRRFPKAAPLYREYGKTLSQLSAEGSPSLKLRAAMMLETAVRLDSSDGEARYLLGNLWLGEGKAREALSELITAAHLSPKESKIRLALWRAYNELGMNAQARKQLNIFRQLQRAAPPRKAMSDVR